MKTIELKRYGEYDKLFTSIKVDSDAFSMEAMAVCDIDDDYLILIGKKDFEKLLANKKDGETGLTIDTKVMYQTQKGYEWWALGMYKRDGKVAPIRKDIDLFPTPIVFSSDHIIPYSLFDPDEPDKWNGTENDYGLKGGAR